MSSGRCCADRGISMSVGPVLSSRSRMFCAVTLEDRETLHNAFFDRGFREDR
jgi:hypothetical protein